MLLESLEHLGVIGDEEGLIYVRPFRLWSDIKWKNAIFAYRLCNAGEILEIFKTLENIPQDAKPQKIALEILARALVSINGQPLVRVSEFKNPQEGEVFYFDVIKKGLLNLEQIVFDHLYLIYKALQEKQSRLLQGKFMCEVCGIIETTIPQNSYKIKNSLGEFIHNHCFNDAIKILYDQDLEKGRE